MFYFQPLLTIKGKEIRYVYKKFTHTKDKFLLFVCRKSQFLTVFEVQKLERKLKVIILLLPTYLISPKQKRTNSDKMYLTLRLWELKRFVNIEYRVNSISYKSGKDFSREYDISTITHSLKNYIFYVMRKVKLYKENRNFNQTMVNFLLNVK